MTRARRRAIDKILAESRDLGEHPQHSVTTGVYCSYRPQAGAAIRWSL